MMYKVRSSGVGGVPASVNPQRYGFATFTDMANYCSDWKHWILGSGCWGYSPAAWADMAALPAFPNLVSPPPAVPAGISTVPAPYSPTDAQAAIDTAIQQGGQQTAQNVQAYSETLPDVVYPASASAWLPWVLGGAALLTVVVMSGGSRRYR